MPPNTRNKKFQPATAFPMTDEKVIKKTTQKNGICVRQRYQTIGPSLRFTRDRQKQPSIRYHGQGKECGRESG